MARKNFVLLIIINFFVFFGVNALGRKKYKGVGASDLKRNIGQKKIGKFMPRPIIKFVNFCHKFTNFYNIFKKGVKWVGVLGGSYKR